MRTLPAVVATTMPLEMLVRTQLVSDTRDRHRTELLKLLPVIMVEDLCPSHKSLAQWFPSPQGAKDTNYDVDTASNKDPLVPGTIAWLESRKRSWRKQRANKRLVDAENFGLTEPAPFKQTR